MIDGRNVLPECHADTLLIRLWDLSVQLTKIVLEQLLMR